MYSLNFAAHVAVAQRIERPYDSEVGCGFESHQSLAHLGAPGLVAWGFFVWFTRNQARTSAKCGEYQA